MKIFLKFILTISFVLPHASVSWAQDGERNGERFLDVQNSSDKSYQDFLQKIATGYCIEKPEECTSLFHDLSVGEQRKFRGLILERLEQYRLELDQAEQKLASQAKEDTVLLSLAAAGLGSISTAFYINIFYTTYSSDKIARRFFFSGVALVFASLAAASMMSDEVPVTKEEVAELKKNINNSILLLSTLEENLRRAGK